MTRRGDSGTGGIAYLDGVCNSFGYGFSAGMSAASDFIPLSYSWNLDVVAHELGTTLAPTTRIGVDGTEVQTTPVAQLEAPLTAATGLKDLVRTAQMSTLAP